MTPVLGAVEHLDVVRLRDLLDAGADANEANEEGWTLLQHAVDAEVDAHDQTCEPLTVTVTAFLLSRGADPLRHSKNSGSPLEMAESRGHWLAAELFRAWLRRSS